MKKNPFYGMSAAAMLLGCYLLNHALELEPGRIGKLLVLIGVLQVYEGLLVALGVFLVATRRAPGDGVTVLLLGTLFLLDATLLATECVTADWGVGAAVAVLLMALAAGKLAVVRRLLPGTLPARVAALLGVQAVLVLGLPVVAVHLAERRLLAPVSLYGLWWVTLALPLARRQIADAIPPCPAGEVRAARTAWTWVPVASVLLHVWALGWIHQVAFYPAFLTPLLLGLAVASERTQPRRQIVLPAIAVVLSLGQAEVLAFPLLGTSGPWVSPLRLAALGAAAAWAILAWRHGYRWLVALAAGAGAAGLAGGSVGAVAESVAGVLRPLGRLVPRDALGWGITGVVGGFVFLALGAWNSVRGGAAAPPSRARRRPSAMTARTPSTG